MNLPATAESVAESAGTHARIAAGVARAILDGFDKHYRLFRDASLQARHCFERADWKAMRDLARSRIEMYDQRVAEAVERLLTTYPQAEHAESLWAGVKLAYIALLHDHRQPELAETFFNSVACQVLHRRYYRNEFIFWRPAVATEHLEGDEPAYRSYYPRKGATGLRATLARILREFELRNPFEDLQRDLRNVVHALRTHFARPTRARPGLQIQVLGSLFFRDRAAYVVGKVMNGHLELPFAVPILQNGNGELYLDTLLVEQDHLLVLFSFARAYFFVDMEVPAAYVSFLRQLMPRKPRAEIYMTIGLHKQGKTVFYRDLHYHLTHSSDNFVTAPGIKGMVMLVFTLPSFPYVFKVIRDRFAPPKETDRATVKQKYLLVKYHDRVGRLADTLEYSLVALPLKRFDAALLEELKAEASSNIEFEGERVVFKHVYIERRMQPLNLFLEEAARDGDAERQRHALREYGDAIKELAAANIFPGDMLLKNFGVTRHNRVVFYDYDEIVYMTECNFRHIPPPRNEEEELSAEPYYAVGPQDVFPEQFAAFLVSDSRAREVFFKYHRDLLDPEFWQGKQRLITEGREEHVFPYPETLRFRRAE